MNTQNKQSSSAIARYFSHIGMNTILGRLLLSASTLIGVVFAVAWWSHIKVNDANINNTQQLSKRVEFSQKTNQINDIIWNIETLFQSYMLVSDDAMRELVLEHANELVNEIQLLRNEEWINSTNKMMSTTTDFHAQAIQLREALIKVMDIRANPLKLYPTMPIMVEELNPLHNEFINYISLALKDDVETDQALKQFAIKEEFYELRHAWMSKIIIFRMLAASRVGIFRYTVEDSIAGSVYNIELFDKQITASLNKLSALDNKQQLGFEQSLALAGLKETNAAWNRHYETVKQILSQENGWRRDTPILQNKITPLFANLWEHLRTLEKELETRAVNDIHTTSAATDQVSNTLWLLVIAVLIVTSVVTLLFEMQIRRPIVRVARAMKAEAEGEIEIDLPDATIDEARDLNYAFTHMRKKIHNRQEHLQAVLTYAADAIITTTLEGFIESFNPAAEFLFNYKASDVVGKNLALFISDFGILSQTTDGSEVASYATESYGDKFPVGINISKMQVGGRNLLLVMIADIRERKAMLDGIQAREQRLRSILDNTAEGIVTFDDNCRIETWNLAAERLFGWREAEIYGSKFSQFIFSETHDNLFEEIKSDNFSRLIGKDNEFVGRHKNGSHYPVSLKISKMLLDGKFKYTALIANISERKAMMENLRYLAEHDSLTHLHNRAYFNVELETVVSRAVTSDIIYALFYIDLDNFKYINDTLGHAAGDKLLVEVAEMLKRRARGSDVVARLGGDEFVVLIADAKLDNIQNIADSYRNTLAEYDFHCEGKTVDVGCSIGVTIIDNTSISPSEKLAQADVACHLAKRAGRNRVHMFSNKDAGDVQTMSIDMGWSRRIRQSLENDRFILAVQPIYTIHDREIASYEILVRMLDDDGSIIMPSGFLPTADRFGLSADIDAWVIEHAIRQMAQFNQRGINIRFSVNLSGQSITTPKIATLIPQMIKGTGIDPAALTFEVTETTAISNIDIAINLLTKLREMGCKTALDDFGSGMSSFAYLQELPVDIVKIDGRFVRNITNSSVDQAMVRAMNDIAHALNKETVAEFVENEHHFKMLSVIGVDFAQGYHLGKPQLITELSSQLLEMIDQKPQSA